MTDEIAPRLQALLDAGAAVAAVTVLRADGSTPRDAGTRMLVTATGIFGTIGGGRLEFDAVAAARALLAEGAAARSLSVPLGPRLGRCDGGHVLLAIDRADAALLARFRSEERAAARAAPTVCLFGAGHVGRALARALDPLPLALRWHDPLGPGAAEPEMAAAPAPCRYSPDPLADLAAAPRGAAVVVMTHNHPLDFALTAAALRRGDFVYVGMIGSATKRECFRRHFLNHGGEPEALQRLVCPVGGRQVRDKHPAVIAAMTAAELAAVLLNMPPGPAGDGEQVFRPLQPVKTMI